MADNQIEEIKRKTDIVEVVGEYVELKKSGRNYKGLCPFHSEKTPSFMVSDELQIFKCFGCGVGGDVYKFLVDYEKIEFPQALKILADRAGVKLLPRVGFVGFEEKEELYKANFLASEFYHYILSSHKFGEPARQYLKNRAVKEETIKLFKIGYAPDRPSALSDFLTKKRNYRKEILEKAGLSVLRNGQTFDRFRGRVVFPLSDHYGNILGFSGRVLVGDREVAKYINSPDTMVYKKGQTLFGLSVTKGQIKKLGFAVVVEGEFDLLSSYQAGVENVVAIKGSAFTPEQAELISRFCPQVYLALDADFAGDQAARRGIEVLKKAGVGIRVVEMTGKFKDPDEFARGDPEGWKKAVEEAESIYDFLIKSTFAKFDAKTTEGKEKISGQLSPVLAAIDDEIVRAHCIKVVAEKLEVGEDAVLREVAKHTRGAWEGRQVSNSPANNQEKDRRQILEDRLLGLVLQKLPANEKIDDIFQTPKAAKLISLLTDYPKKDFNLVGFGESLPSELKDYFAQIFFGAPEVDEEQASKETENIKREIELLNVRQQVKILTGKIAQEEEKGTTEGLESISHELEDSLARLAQLSKE